MDKRPATGPLPAPGTGPLRARTGHLVPPPPAPAAIAAAVEAVRTAIGDGLEARVPAAAAADATAGLPQAAAGVDVDAALADATGIGVPEVVSTVQAGVAIKDAIAQTLADIKELRTGVETPEKLPGTLGAAFKVVGGVMSGIEAYDRVADASRRRAAGDTLGADLQMIAAGGDAATAAAEAAVGGAALAAKAGVKGAESVAKGAMKVAGPVAAVANVADNLVEIYDALNAIPPDYEQVYASSADAVSGVLMVIPIPPLPAIGALVQAAVVIYENWDDICEVADAAWDAAGDAVEAVEEAVGDFFAGW